MGLDATAGVSGGAAPDGMAGHWVTSGAGGRIGSRPHHIDLPELGDVLFQLVLLLGHSFILRMDRKPYLRGAYTGGGPVARAEPSYKETRPSGARLVD